MMVKRYNYEPTLYEPPEKRSSIEGAPLAVDLKPGTILTDVLGRKWRLGKTIGTGGFGEIYLASDNINHDVKTDAQYVAKVESHSNGPLFVEIHCYLRIAKSEMINEWKEKNKMTHLGMPHYVTSGSHVLGSNKYRFLILPRFEKDLEKVFEAKKCKFNLKTVLTVAYQTMDTLKYIHSKGYIHSDIKASNILFNNNSNRTKNRPVILSPPSKLLVRYTGCRPIRTCKVRKLDTSRLLRPNANLRCLDIRCRETSVKPLPKQPVKSCDMRVDQIYLLDYGLASKYVSSSGEHKHFSEDARKAHAGTILFCSRDAHQGVQSRRSDLETLGYNMVHWLTTNLPWTEHVEDREIVYKMKKKCIENVRMFLNLCFNRQCPRFLFDYFNYLQNLKFNEEPNYAYCQDLFKDALREYGYNDNLLLDFDNLEGWGRKQKKTKKRNSENFAIPRAAIQIFKRSPLKSNLPNLRKQGNKKINQQMKWSKILMDPETIMKNRKSKEKKTVESNESNSSPVGILNLDLDRLNPTAAMVEVFNKSMERFNVGEGTSPRYRGDIVCGNINGYTPAMMDVHNRKKEREEFEYQQLLVANSKSNNKSSKSKSGSKVQKKKAAVVSNKSSKKRTNLNCTQQNVRILKIQSNVTVHKKETPVKHLKTLPLRRTYSLRG